MTTKRAPVLIANRGEIAIRVARTAKALGFPTVAVYSTADRWAEHTKYCDSSIEIGPEAPGESYLLGERLMEAAKKTGAKYLHPGYGFLSERAPFVELCEKNDIVFIGPSASVIEQMGDKIKARRVVEEINLPIVPGSAGVLPSGEEAIPTAARIGYPILLKAAAGGGGKGMRRVDREEDVVDAFNAASREALNAFGDGSVYIEKLILNPHHVEVQIFGDGKGGAVHLWERECSVQRRHQKVFEETPSPLMMRYPEARERMLAAAVELTRHIKYSGAGTVEFVTDDEGNFYFLEMNTRLQVEHPVTEWVTGVDLVEWQLLLAVGEWTLPSESPDLSGAAMEARIYAEDPSTFLPAPGTVGIVHAPSGPFVRWDSSLGHSGNVGLSYDPMIAKLSTWGLDRKQALGRLRVALDETRVEPPMGPQGLTEGSLRTNLQFLRRLVRHQRVAEGDTTTDLIANDPALTAAPSEKPDEITALAAALLRLTRDAQDRRVEAKNETRRGWVLSGRQEGVRL